MKIVESFPYIYGFLNHKEAEAENGLPNITLQWVEPIWNILHIDPISEVEVGKEQLALYNAVWAKSQLLISDTSNVAG